MSQHVATTRITTRETCTNLLRCRFQGMAVVRLWLTSGAEYQPDLAGRTHKKPSPVSVRIELIESALPLNLCVRFFFNTMNSTVLQHFASGTVMYRYVPIVTRSLRLISFPYNIC